MFISRMLHRSARWLTSARWKPHRFLRSVAEHYLYARRAHHDTLRFEVIAILADRPNVRIHDLEEAF
jgi:Holliday junction resolvase-like predicted endonuclease